MFRKIIAGAVLLCPLLLSFPSYAAQDILLPLKSYSATQVSNDKTRTNETKVHFIIVVNSVAGGGATITPSIEGKDYLGNYYTLLQGTAISSTGTTVLKIGLGLAVILNGVSADYIPDVYRIKMTQSGSGNFTYSVTINSGQ